VYIAPIARTLNDGNGVCGGPPPYALMALEICMLKSDAYQNKSLAKRIHLNLEQAKNKNPEITRGFLL
jgi:hypothetical protein